MKPFNRSDWFNFFSTLGAIATFIGVIFGIVQGRAALKEANANARLARKSRLEKFLEVQLALSFSAENQNDIIKKISDRAKVGGLTDNDMLVMLSNVLLRRGFWPGGKIDSANVHDSAHKMLLSAGVLRVED